MGYLAPMDGGRRATALAATFGVHAAMVLLLLAMPSVVPRIMRESVPIALFDLPPPPLTPPVDPPTEIDEQRPVDADTKSAPRAMLAEGRGVLANLPPQPATVPLPESMATALADTDFLMPPVGPLASASGLDTRGLGAAAAAAGLGGGGDGGVGQGGDGDGRGARYRRAAWVRTPSQHDFERHRPPGTRRQTAEVWLSCHVRRNLSLHRCQIIAEQPAGAGLGPAALRLAERVLIEPVRRNGQRLDIPHFFAFNFTPGGGGVASRMPPSALARLRVQAVSGVEDTDRKLGIILLDQD